MPSKIVVLYRVMETRFSIHELSDERLVDEVDRLAKIERGATAALIAGLAEFDKRRLHLALGFSSLFVYCTTALHLSEDAAFCRIEAARAARKFPALITHLAAGDITLTAARLLAPHLTATSYKTLLAEARHKSKRDVELLVAKHRPLPPVASTVRKLPTLITEPRVSTAPDALAVSSVPQEPPAPSAPQPPSRRPLVKPLSAESYRLQITMSRDTHDKLRRVQALMRHRVPNGDPAEIFDRALDALLREVEKTQCAYVDRPRGSKGCADGSRHIPSSVKRDVWKRDGARCRFEGPDGRRCAEIDFLEFHHVVPHARGGRTSVDNLELRCRAHNAYEAERDFGPRARRGPARGASPAI